MIHSANQNGWLADVQAFWAFLGLGSVSLIILSAALAILSGRGLRLVVYFAWRLGLDRERRLAGIGNATEIGLCIVLAYFVVRRLSLVAPLTTLLALLILSPVLLLIFRPLLQDVAAGFELLLRNRVRPGDYVTWPSGSSGILRQIHLTRTSLRNDSGATVIVPNRALLEGTIEIERRQAGIPVTLDLDLDHAPSPEMEQSLLQIAYFSPYRTQDAVPRLIYLKDQGVLRLRTRVHGEHTKGLARHELSLKLSKVLDEAAQRRKENSRDVPLSP